MPAHGATRFFPPRFLLAGALLLGGPTACLGARSGEDQTVDQILRQLDETSRQRTADAQRIEDLSRRIAVLETLLQAERDRLAAGVPAAPAPGEPTAPAAPPTSREPEATPVLPVVRLTPPAAEPADQLVAVAQGAATRAAPDVVVEEPEAPDPADELSDIPYQGVGFGNGGSDGYLRIDNPGAATIRLVGAPRPPVGAPATAGAAGTTVVPVSSGGTPSSAFGDVPRLPPMASASGTAEAPAVASPAVTLPAYEAGVEAYRSRRWQEAIGWFDRALAQGLDEAQGALALFFKAEATYQTRAYLDAVGLFERFAGRYPGHARAAEALLRIGSASERLGDTDRAAELYRRIVAEHPASSAAATAAARLEAAGTEGRQP
jgi:TolA-binding protein